MARKTAAPASTKTIVRFFSGTAVSSRARRISGGMAPTTAARITVIRKPMSCLR